MDTADDTTVTVDGDTVVKIHRAGTDPHELAARLRIASASGCLLTPLSADPEAISTPRLEVHCNLLKLPGIEPAVAEADTIGRETPGKVPRSTDDGISA